MDGAITAIITSMCMGLSGNGHDACYKAGEAGAKQSGIEQEVDTLQKHVERDADKTAHEYLGETTMSVAGGGVFVVKTIVDKSLKFNTPTFGLCDRITNEVGINKYSLHLEWGF